MGAAEQLPDKDGFDQNSEQTKLLLVHSPEKEKRKKRAFLLLFGLALGAVLFLLGAHALMTGEGSLFWDIGLGFFASISTVAMFSGIIFPIFVLLVIPILPFVVLYYYIKITRNDKGA